MVYDYYLLFIDSDYGTTLKSFRIKNGLTQKEFSALVNSRGAAKRWESGRAKPTRASYEIIQKVFKEYKHQARFASLPTRLH
jgi:transcriptional regulator with XRE-family HTH domain